MVVNQRAVFASKQREFLPTVLMLGMDSMRFVQFFHGAYFFKNW
jgi:hypothetical protein